MQRLSTAAIAAVLVTMLAAPAGQASIGGNGGTDPHAAPPPTFEPIDVSRIDPQLRPFLLDSTRRVTVIVKVAGSPVAVAQAEAASRGEQLSDPQRGTLRAQLRARQDAMRPGLERVGAHVLAQYQDALNGIKVQVALRDLGRLSRLPGVEQVLAVPQYSMANTTSDAFTGVPGAWSVPPGLTGRGVKVAVIDTGIDYYHADLGGSGDPGDYAADDGLTIGTPAFPNGKVAGGFDFVGNDYDAGGTGDATVPQPDPDPLDCEGHGTHVAATLGGFGETADGRTYRGPYDATTLSRQHFLIGPGVAPEVKLYALKVFGCTGSTNVVVDAIDWAVKNGMNVINLSLGAPFGSFSASFGSPNSPDAIAANNAAAAGIVVVAAAGNDGSGSYLASTPGVASRAIEIAAVDATASFPTATIAVGPGTGPGTGTTMDIGAIDANEATGFPVTGRLDVLKNDTGGIGLGCDATDYADVAQGDIVVTVRGTCPRVDRATLGQAAGAAAVIMVNNTQAENYPPFEGAIKDVTIPFLGVKPSAGAALLAADGTSATITGGTSQANPTFRHAADFSSGGPRSGDSALKPDVAAPGVSVFSAAAGTGSEGERESGTSMATPHVAGVAALVKQAHPAWTPEQIKAAIMNTASASDISGYDPRLAGSGLVQPRRAVDTAALATTGAGTASLSFGAVALDAAASITRTVRIQNVSGAAIAYRLTSSFIGPTAAARVSLSRSRVTVPAHRSISVGVTLSLSAAAVAALPGADKTGGLTALTAVRGAVVATPTTTGRGIYPLRVPFLFAPRAVSDVVAPATVSLTADANSGKDVGSIVVRNRGIRAGVADVYAWGLRSGPTGSGSVDIRAVGVESLTTGLDGTPLSASDRMLVFAINTYQAWGTPAVDEFDIAIDTDRSDSPEYVLTAADHGLVTAGQPDGRLACFVFRVSDGSLLEGAFANAPLNSSTLRCGILASSLGLSSAGQPIDYIAHAASLVSAEADDMPGVGHFDAFGPAISQGKRIALAPKASATISLSLDPGAFATQSALGWMIVSPDDPSGPAQAETIPAVLPGTGG